MGATLRINALFVGATFTIRQLSSFGGGRVESARSATWVWVQRKHLLNCVRDTFVDAGCGATM